MTMNHLILDFSHVYEDENIPEKNTLHWLDCADITGCDLYCSAEAREQIWNRIQPYGIRGIHFLDSGNYHYVTGIITDHIRQDFSLVLFDHHTDMQKPLIEGMMNCGDWAGHVLDTNDRLQQLVLIGPQQRDIDQISCAHKDRLLTFSAEELKHNAGREKLAKIKRDLPVYISIDKDVLGENYAETNWNQGDMSLAMLEQLLLPLLTQADILGIDICGECQPGMPLPEYFEAEEVNSKTNRELFAFIKRYI